VSQDNEPSLLARAGQLSTLGRKEAAAELYEQVLASNPESDPALIGLAYVRMDKDPRGALARAKQAAAQAPDSVRAHTVAAWCHEGCGNNDAAIEHGRRVVELTPDSSDAHQTLAQLLCSRNRARDPSEARQSAGTAIRLDPQNSLAWFAMARVDLLEDKQQEARGSLHRALEIDPNFAEAQQTLAALDRFDGNKAGALATLHFLVRQDPTNESSRDALDATLQDLLQDFLWAAFAIGLILAFVMLIVVGGAS